MRSSGERLTLQNWRAAILSGLAVTLALRLGLGLIMGAAWLVLRPYLIQNLNVREYQGFGIYDNLLAETCLGVWPRWDAIHHLNLARHGYLNLSLAESVFYPLYAGLVRLITPLAGGDYLIGGLIISTLSAWAAFTCLFRLAETHYDLETARWTVAALAVYPTAVFLVAPFTESLFLALTLGAFLAAYARRWWLSGLLGFLASLARGPGMLTAAALAWIAWQQWRTQSHRKITFAVELLAGLALPVLGGLAFIAWRQWLGYPPINQITQQYSGLILVNPLRGLVSAAAQWVRVHDLQTTLDFASALFFIGITITMAIRPSWRKPEWLVYMTLNMLLFLSKESFVASSLQSLARYVLALFPAFIVLGGWLKNQSPTLRLIYLSFSGGLLVFLSILYELWIFIG